MLDDVKIKNKANIVQDPVMKVLNDTRCKNCNSYIYICPCSLIDELNADVEANMCQCKIVTDLDYHLVVESHSVFMYEPFGEYVTDFEINYCPFCGEKKTLKEGGRCTLETL